VQGPTHYGILKNVSNDLEHNWLHYCAESWHVLHDIQHGFNSVQQPHGNHCLLVGTTVSVQNLDQCSRLICKN
jgi:hypothetical protein